MKPLIVSLNCRLAPAVFVAATTTAAAVAAAAAAAATAAVESPAPQLKPWSPTNHRLLCLRPCAGRRHHVVRGRVASDVHLLPRCDASSSLHSTMSFALNLLGLRSGEIPVRGPELLFASAQMRLWGLDPKAASCDWEQFCRLLYQMGGRV